MSIADLVRYHQAKQLVRDHGAIVLDPGELLDLLVAVVMGDRHIKDIMDEYVNKGDIQ